MSGVWWRIWPSISGDTTRVDLFDDIGGDDNDSAFLAALQSVRTPKIDLHVNSDGGNITTGIAVLNALKAHPAEVTACIDSLAASIASVIACGADRVVIAPEAFMMIHNGRATMSGSAENLRSAADSIEKMTAMIAGVYAEKTGRPVEEIAAKMKAETWFSAGEAKAFGLVDEVAGQVNSMAMRSMLNRGRLPDGVRSQVARFVAQKDKPMKSCNVYCKDGKHYADIDGETMEMVLPPPAKTTTTVEHENRVESEEDKQAKAKKMEDEKAKARQEGIDAERAYRGMFNTVLASAKLTGETAAEFEKNFYGRAESDLKFLASHAVGQRAQALGEGADDAGADKETAELAKIDSECKQRFAADARLRRVYGVVTNNVMSQDYLRGLNRLIAAERKCYVDQKSPAREGDNEGDRVGKMLSNRSILA